MPGSLPNKGLNLTRWSVLVDGRIRAAQVSPKALSSASAEYMLENGRFGSTAACTTDCRIAQSRPALTPLRGWGHHWVGKRVPCGPFMSEQGEERIWHRF